MNRPIDDEKNDQDMDLEQDEQELDDSIEDIGTDDNIGDEDYEYDDDISGGGSGGRRSSVDDLKAIDRDKALRANPKRGQWQRQAIRSLDGISSIDELADSTVARRIWNQCAKETRYEDAIPYVVTNDYSMEDVIEHPMFGRGFVVEVRSNTKFAVLFKDGLRRLMYNIKP